MRTRVLLAAALAVLALLCAAPAALAVPASVRVEGADHQIIPSTRVEVPAGGTAIDTAGHSFTTSFAAPLLAADIAANRHGVPWGFTEYAGMGVFIDSFAGSAMDPATYANWWEFVVNGYNSPLGVVGFPTRSDDRYLFFQNPDGGYPPHGAKVLVVRAAPARGVVPGTALTLSVVGDDVAKVNSQADASRFETTDIETPSQFQPVSGATLHVGTRVYQLTGDSLTVGDLPRGTFAVWAEKTMDDTWVYARSSKVTVDVHPAPVVSALSVWPHRFRRDHGLAVNFRLSRAARVRLTIRNAAGVLLASRAVDYRAGGAKTIIWPGHTARRLGAAITVTVRAIDDWGRSSTQRLRVPVVR